MCIYKQQHVSRAGTKNLSSEAWCIEVSWYKHMLRVWREKYRVLQLTSKTPVIPLGIHCSICRLVKMCSSVAGLNVMLTSTPVFQLPFVGISASLVSFLFRSGRCGTEK